MVPRSIKISGFGFKVEGKELPPSFRLVCGKLEPEGEVNQNHPTLVSINPEHQSLKRGPREKASSLTPRGRCNMLEVLERDRERQGKTGRDRKGQRETERQRETESESAASACSGDRVCVCVFVCVRERARARERERERGTGEGAGTSKPGTLSCSSEMPFTLNSKP